MLSHLLNKNIDTVSKEKQYDSRRKEEQKKLLDDANKKFISPLEILNKEQYASATSTSSNNLVIASAGTGKTSTIIGRVYYLITEKKFKPDEIILLTFTSKAGQEMLERLLKYFDRKTVDKIFAGTFHSYAKSILEKNNKEKKKLLSDNDISRIMKNIYWNLINQTSLEAEKCIAPSTIAEYYSLYRNTFSVKNPILFDEFLISLKKDITAIQAGFYADVASLYEEEKNKYNLVDFTDFLEFLRDLSKKRPLDFKEVIVDEYQDTNRLQNDILYNFSTITSASLFCVGDFDQSIYGFNGSDVNVMSEFPEIYKCSVLFLEKNYRSCKPILDLAERLISINPRIFNKKLVPMVQKTFQEPTFEYFKDSRDEHSFIVETISESSYDYNDIAILYRSNKSGDLIEMELLENDIPVDRQDKSNFLQTSEAQLFLSFIKLMKSPNVIDFYNSIYGVFSDDISKKMFNLFIQEGRGDFYKSVSSNFLKNSILKLSTDKGKIESFLTLVRKISFAKTPLDVYNIILSSEYFSIYISKSENKKYPALTTKKIDVLKTIFSNNNDFKKILIKESLSSSSNEDKYGVKLLTAHASKGLEFKKVFIIHLTDIKFPNQKLLTSVEEERRLMYVAITRAKEVLYLTASRRYGTKDEKPSRFLQECGL